MAQYKINDTTLTAIGDAIRNKTGDLTRIESVPIELPIVYDVIIPVGGRIENIITDSVTVNDVAKVKLVFTFNYGSVLSHSTDGIGIYNDNTSLGTVRLTSGKNQEVEYQITGNTAKIRFTSSTPYTQYGVKIEIYYYDIDNNLITTTMMEKEVPNTMTPAQMADVIDALPPAPSAEELIITGQCNFRFAYNGWNWVIARYGDIITTKDITSANSMFSGSSKLAAIPFDINFSNTTSVNCENLFNGCSSLTITPKINGTTINMYYMFYNCSQLVEIPDINWGTTTGSMSNVFYGCKQLATLPYIYNAYPTTLSYFFTYCSSLKSIPEDYMDTWNFDYITKDAYASTGSIFSNCYGLRSIPSKILSKLRNDKVTGSYNKTYGSMFNCCYSLDEINGLAVDGATMTSNMFSYTFQTCTRVKNITFETNEDGTPKTANWKSQIIDLSSSIGYGTGTNLTYMAIYSPEISEDKWMRDDASYQALKDDPDNHAYNIEYSRYNHDSAVATINSLPDTSAYGTNTIKFKGAAGAKTDGGAINTLTEEEIAVATAKGWTVTLV